MSRTAGDSEAVRELAKSLLYVLHDITLLNKKNKELLVALRQIWRDPAVDKLEEDLEKIIRPIYESMKDVEEICGKLYAYAAFLASLDDDGGSGGTAAGTAAVDNAGTTAVAASIPPRTGCQLAECEISHDEKMAWIRSVVPGCSEEEAADIVLSMERYSNGYYSGIHGDSAAEKQETQNILRVFDAGKAPVYDGVIYRGLHFSGFREVMQTLRSSGGVWKEPGVTSFSSDQLISEKQFAAHYGREWGLLLTCKNNKTAIPFCHMSVNAYEMEVLSPGGHRNQGWDIDWDSLIIDEEAQMIYVDIYER